MPPGIDGIDLLGTANLSLFTICSHLGVPPPRGNYERRQRLDVSGHYINCMRYLNLKGVQPEAVVRAVAETIAVSLQRGLSGYVCHVRVTSVNGMDTVLAAPGVEPTLIVGDQAYRLVPSYHPNGDTLKHAIEEVKGRESELRTAYEVAVRAGQEELRRQLAAMQQELTRQHPLPLITLEDAQRGVFVFAEAGYAYIGFPFHYSPKYITWEISRPNDEFASEWMELTTEDKQATDRRVAVCFPVGDGGLLGRPTLLTPPPELVDFRHYHSGCWGTWRLPGGVRIPHDLYTIVTQLEVELYTINRNSLADATPPGMPRAIDLAGRATACEPPVFEVPAPVPAPAPMPGRIVEVRARNLNAAARVTQTNTGVWNLG